MSLTRALKWQNLSSLWAGLRFGWLCLFVLGMGTAAKAETGVELPKFRVNAIAVYQGASNSYSGQLSWIPTFSLASAIGIRAEVGVTLLKTLFGDRFLAGNYEGFLWFTLIPEVALELGGGMSTWFGNGGTFPIASADISVSLPSVFDHVFLGYSRFFMGATPANEIKLGLGFVL